MNCPPTSEASYAIELAVCLETCADPILGPTDALLAAEALRHYATLLEANQSGVGPASPLNIADKAIGVAA